MKSSNYTDSPPERYKKIETIDAHTGGEPLRVIVDGLPPLDGSTVLAKRRYFERELDEYRRALMWEPRGHADMYGAVLTEPNDENADFGVVFMHNEGYSTMCGHGIIALAKIIHESECLGIGSLDDEITIDTPAGRVVAEVEQNHHGIVESVEFTNVPSFVYARSQKVSVPSWGTIEVDIAFGGAFYAYFDAEQINLELTPGNFETLVDVGRSVKTAVANSVESKHPYEDDLGFLYGTIITSDPHTDSADSRNVCVFADGEVDRCPTGTGVSGRVALQAERDALSPNELFTVESIVGSKFTGSYEKALEFGGYQAVQPKVSGSAYIMGRHEFLIDPADPFGEGFFLR
ncbi:proline racemase [halophilic archaeon]|nr:proline racemase [halophilic archaeon]